MNRVINVLLIEDNPGDVGLVKDALRPGRGMSFEVTHADRLSQADKLLEENSYDVLLVDLFLPDSSGLNTLVHVHARAPNTAIVVFTGLEDEAIGLEAVRQGAQDYLIKGRASSRLVSRAIAYALERMAADEQLKALNDTLERRVLERTAAMERYANEWRATAAKLAAAEHVERRRLAQHLHDNLQQLLAATRTSVAYFRKQLASGDRGQLEATAAKLDQLLHEAIDATHSLTLELSPPVLYEQGLTAAMNWLAESMKEKHNLVVTVQADAAADSAGDDIKAFLYQAARELLFNVIKHANAGQAEVSLGASGSEQVQLTVTDHGGGFDVNRVPEKSGGSSSFGLFSIRDRARLLGGGVVINNPAGGGASVTVTVPRRLSAPVKPAATAADIPSAADFAI